MVVRQAGSEKKGGCSENCKERENKTIRRGTRTQKKCKRVVAIAKESAYSQQYEELKGREGRKNIYKLANARKIMATDIGRVTAVQSRMAHCSQGMMTLRTDG